MVIPPVGALGNALLEGDIRGVYEPRGKTGRRQGPPLGYSKSDIPDLHNGKGELRFTIDGGAGMGTARYSAVSGEDLGFLLFGDPTLYNDSTIKSGYMVSVGAGLQYFLNSAVALTGGVSYTYQTFTVTYPANTAAEDLIYRLGFGYINMLVGPRLFLDQFFIGGGLFYGSETNYDAEVYMGSKSYSTVNLETEGSNFGLFLEAGFEIELSENDGLLIFARYRNGLSKVYDQPDAVTGIKLIDLSLNIGYTTRL